VGTVPVTGLVEPGTAGLEPGSDGQSGSQPDTSSGGPGEAPAIEHVPIKKKGSRKR
jgi:ribonuclease E